MQLLLTFSSCLHCLSQKLLCSFQTTLHSLYFSFLFLCTIITTLTVILIIAPAHITKLKPTSTQDMITTFSILLYPIFAPQTLFVLRSSSKLNKLNVFFRHLYIFHVLFTGYGLVEFCSTF